METFCKVILKKVGLKGFLYDVNVSNRRSFLSETNYVGLETGTNPQKGDNCWNMSRNHQFDDNWWIGKGIFEMKNSFGKYRKSQQVR